ncbi:hypothetical protein PV664_35900 [Streptomyces sp. ME01-18a]|uniref:hypothetical protein n=1 Tax=Streptomyces sp. ME01-18a TaxID=3028669 RepID=UPI0029B1DF25|nr:hypothetical protein [Streptomyces sp. ME01-18a]MDX3434237.1 hypothetical protein [Streptomyces sp. ME01-18a]
MDEVKGPSPQARGARAAERVEDGEPGTIHRVVQVAASIGAASANSLGTSSLSLLQRAADTALYKGKHTGRAVLASRADLTAASVNGRRAGRPGTHTVERTA